MAAQPSSQVDALLVGYESQENLGLRSIMAFLRARGYRVELAPFVPGRDAAILAAARRLRPRLIGFSIIFQYTLDEFGRLMRALREGGIRAHFTAGGHFPSLRPAEALGLLPDLDSVVRFEGEETLAELIDALDQPLRWPDLQGLAFRRAGEIAVNQPRPLIANLDDLPPIYRDEPRLTGAGVPMASMLASRGCLFNCSFCSIRQFYGGAAGALRRARSPEAVVREMHELFVERGVRLFIFQDDDFAARSPRQRAWLRSFLDALAAAGLAEQVRWKISCRVDDLEPEILRRMQAHGLMAIYLGVESGSEQGLRTLNKHVSVAQNLAAIELLERHEVGLAIGFMLFDPASTFQTVSENIAFLRTIGASGYFPINFCKMLPYAGTPIEAQLIEAGRLKGSVTQPDYDFLDPRLDWYAFLVQRIFAQRNFSPGGLVTRLQQAGFDYHLARSLGADGLPADYGPSLRGLTRRANESALETLETLLDMVLSRGPDALLDEGAWLIELAEREWRAEAAIEVELEALRCGAALAAAGAAI